MLTIATGYEPYALQNGGYPIGYMVAAATAELRKESVHRPEKLPGERWQNCFINTATVSMLEVVGVGETTSYSAEDGETLLSRYHDIYSEEGILNANYRVGLGTDKARVGYVKLDGQAYQIVDDETRINSLLGYHVEIFYRSQLGSDERQIVYVDVPDGKNEVLTIDCEDVTSFTGNTVYYNDEERDRAMSARISTSAYVVINDALCDSYTEEDLKIIWGRLPSFLKMAGATALSISRHMRITWSAVFLQTAERSIINISRKSYLNWKKKKTEKSIFCTTSMEICCLCRTLCPRIFFL